MARPDVLRQSIVLAEQLGYDRGHRIEAAPDEMVEKIEEQRALGVEHLVLEFLARDPAHRRAQLEAFAAKVRPRLGA
jgi:hypothetical protein